MSTAPVQHSLIGSTQGLPTCDAGLFHNIDTYHDSHPDEGITRIPRPTVVAMVHPWDLIDFDVPPGIGTRAGHASGRPSGSTHRGRPTTLAQNDPIPRLMDTRQAAAYLGTTERFIRRCIADGRLVVVKVGRHNRYTPADLDKLTRRSIAGSPTATPRTHPAPAQHTPPAVYDPIAEAVARAKLSPPQGT